MLELVWLFLVELAWLFLALTPWHTQIEFSFKSKVTFVIFTYYLPFNLLIFFTENDKCENDIYALRITTLQLLMKQNHMVKMSLTDREHIKLTVEENALAVSPRLKWSGCKKKHRERLKELALKSLPAVYMPDYEYATLGEWSLLVNLLNMDTFNKFKGLLFKKITKHGQN